MGRKVSSFIFCLISFCGLSQPEINVDQNDYSFIVAGHAYGSHFEDNIGLYPTFYKLLEQKKIRFDFAVFTGDAVRGGEDQGFIKMNKELDVLKIPFYLCLGNHEAMNTDLNFFKKNYGGRYYNFHYGTEKFIVLDSQEEPLKISSNQIEFLQASINDTLHSTKNVFIFFHELLWNSDKKYAGIKSNSRCRYENIKGKSNFWEEIYPILLKNNDKTFYVIAGDVAGNSDAIPAFYEKIKNVHLIASGMGEVNGENFLRFSVKNSFVTSKLYQINGLKEESLESYTSDSIINYNSPKSKPLSYSIRAFFKRLYDSRIVRVTLLFSAVLWFIRFVKKYLTKH